MGVFWLDSFPMCVFLYCPIKSVSRVGGVVRLVCWVLVVSASGRSQGLCRGFLRVMFPKNTGMLMKCLVALTTRVNVVVTWHILSLNVSRAPVFRGETTQKCRVAMFHSSKVRFVPGCLSLYSGMPPRV